MGQPAVRGSNRSDSRSCSFRRHQRLLNAADYANVFGKGIRVGNQYWSVVARPVDTDVSRLGLAIAKKRAKRAVDRNKLKRIARESFRHHSHALAGYDLVVLNRDQAASADPSVLATSLVQLWSKLIRRRGRRSA